MEEEVGSGELTAWNCAIFGELDGLKKIKEAGLDLDASDSRSFTPLCWASRNGHSECIDFLVENECNIEAATFGGLRPLHHACNKNLERIAKKLISLKADPNATDDNLDTPLHYSCARGVLNIVVAIMNAGGDIAKPNSQGITPFHKACIFGHIAVIRKLADQGADINCADNSGDTPLHFASRCGFATAIKLLLDRGATADSVNALGQTPLQVAVNAATAKVFESE